MKRYLLFTVFISGMTTLAAELAASRLIGNVFGTSNLVWASIIGLILIYLTVGYFIGGRWADKTPTARAMYRALAWGAFTLGLVPYIAGPVLRFAANAAEQLQVGFLIGAFAAVLVLFSVPITLLGTISPFAIRLSVDDTATAGVTSGTIYAVSTLGSFIGTFLPVLVTIPTIGTRNTFLLFGMMLLIVALIGLARFASPREMLKYLWMPFALLIIAIVYVYASSNLIITYNAIKVFISSIIVARFAYLRGVRLPSWTISIVLVIFILLYSNSNIKSNTGQVYETESAYNYIQVQVVNGFTLLRLNDGQGIHSIYHPDTLQYGGPWEQFLVGPYFYANRKPSDVKRMAIVGLAAGTTARQARAVYKDIQIDGFELDPKIVDVGKKYFDMNMPNLNIRIGDGRWNLEQSKTLYDIIAVDAYRPPYIPPHMTTQEFFQICASHLTENGVLTINVGSVPGDRRLINGLATTMATILPSVHVMDIPGTLNTMIFATKQKTEPTNFAANLLALSPDQSVHPLLLIAMQTTFANLKPGYETTQVFTDDRAPIEWIVNDMVVRFVMTGGLEYLQ